jgi:hypothetical protein
MPFFDEHNGGPGIGSAFDGLTPDSKVRLEWFDDAEDESLILADYSIRDGRLNKEVFHPLTLLIQLKYRNGDDKCMVRFGRYDKDLKLEELMNSLKSLTVKPVSKKQLISIIKKSIDLYQKNVIGFHLNNYGLAANNMIQQHPDDFLNFKKYLGDFYTEENNKKNRKDLKRVNKEDGYTPMWIVLTTLLSVVLLVIYMFLLFLRW